MGEGNARNKKSAGREHEVGPKNSKDGGRESKGPVCGIGVYDSKQKTAQSSCKAADAFREKLLTKQLDGI